MFYKLINYLNTKNNFPYYICTPLVYSIGNASEHIYTAAAHAKRSGKKILIFKTKYLKNFLNYNVCNNELFESLILNNQSESKNLFYQLVDFLIQIEFVVRRFFAIILKKYMNIDLGESFRFPFLGSRDLYFSDKFGSYNSVTPLSIRECEADLIKKKKEECLRILEASGVKDKKFICLHVRDDNYYNDSGRREYRNSNIDNYIDLINYLIEKDYCVFRLGDKPAPKVKFSNKNFFDLPYSDLKSEIMDLFLIKECEFYVGTISGTMDTAYLFNKPTFLTNMYDLFPSFPRKKNDRGIFKKILDKKKGNFLNIKQFAELSINYHHCETDIKDLSFQDNTAEDLLEGIDEYYNFINSKNKVNKEKFTLDTSQLNCNRFLNIRLEEIYKKDFIENKFFKNDIWKKNEFMRIVKRFKACEGSFNTSYLKKNFQ